MGRAKREMGQRSNFCSTFGKAADPTPADGRAERTAVGRLAAAVQVEALLGVGRTLRLVVRVEAGQMTAGAVRAAVGAPAALELRVAFA